MPVASEEGYITYDGTHNGRGVYDSTFAPTLSRRVVDDCADVGERVQEWEKKWRWSRRADSSKLLIVMLPAGEN